MQDKNESIQPLTLYTSFHDLINVYSRRSGTDNLGDKILMSTETSCHFGNLLQVLKKISFKTDFIQCFFHDFMHVYSPGAGTNNPLGTKFYVNRNILSLRSFVASFKKSL